MTYELSSFTEQMDKCSHCAFCQATCPVFLEDLVETHMPRARMNLAKAALVDKSINQTKRLEQIIDRCLLCGNCVRTCPAAVPVNDIVIAARKQLYKGKRKNIFERNFLNSFMANRGMDFFHRAAFSIAKKAGKIPDGALSSKSKKFCDEFCGTFPAKGKKRARVAYYVGCATNSTYLQTGRAVLNVFAKNGIEVIVPEGLICCGAPALAEGDIDTAYNMALHNVKILADLDVDAIVTDCTTCGLMLKENAIKLAPFDTPLMEKAMAVAAKTWETTDYLNNLGLGAIFGPLNTKITYHVPCHGQWSPTLADAPRDLAQKVPETTLVEMDEPESCCGAGGAFFLDNFKLSSGIREKKMSQIARTKATAVLTQCPACRGFIMAGAPDVNVMHPMDFLAQAYDILEVIPRPI